MTKEALEKEYKDLKALRKYETIVASAEIEKLQAENAELARKLKIETELSKRLGVANREYEQLTKEQDEHLERLEEEKCELLGLIQGKDKVIVEAKGIINAFLDFEASAMERGCYIADDTRKKAEGFIRG